MVVVILNREVRASFMEKASFEQRHEKTKTKKQGVSSMDLKGKSRNRLGCSSNRRGALGSGGAGAIRQASGDQGGWALGLKLSFQKKWQARAGF